LSSGVTRAQQGTKLLLLLVLAVVGVWIGLWAGSVPAGAEDHCNPLDITCEPVDDTTTSTTTLLETTTTVEETTTTQARPSTTTTRPASRPTTTTMVEVEITTTTLGVTTSTNLLVPGDGTEGAESTTTSEATVAISSTDDGPSDGTLIGIVVVGLVLIALAVGVLTWRYWLATRPLPAEDAGRPAPAG